MRMQDAIGRNDGVKETSHDGIRDRRNGKASGDGRGDSRMMNDKELRAYRRRQRRIHAVQRRCITAVMTVCLVILCAFSFNALKTSASTGTGDACFKYYTNITVESGETLWSIAGTYMDDVNYGSRRAYIAEVCSINNLRSADELKAGQMLIVPYYSGVYVE